jgi:hypothetical protein
MVALGGVAAWSMSGVAAESTKHLDTYVPAVKVANHTEWQSLMTMFEMRD